MCTSCVSSVLRESFSSDLPSGIIAEGHRPDRPSSLKHLKCEQIQNGVTEVRTLRRCVQESSPRGGPEEAKEQNGSSLPSGSAADTHTCVCLTAACCTVGGSTDAQSSVSTNGWSQKLRRRVKSTDVGKLLGTWEFPRVAQPMLMSSCCKGLVDQIENSSAKMLYFCVYMNRGSTGGKSAEARVSWFYSWRHCRCEEDASLGKTGMDIESFGLPVRLQLTDWQLVAEPR